MTSWSVHRPASARGNGQVRPLSLLAVALLTGLLLAGAGSPAPGQPAPAAAPPPGASVGSGAVKVTVGFTGHLVETRIQAPRLTGSATAEWVTSDTVEVRQAHAAPAPGKKTWSPNVYLPGNVPARPGQPDDVPQTREVPVPFGQPSGGAAAAPAGPAGPVTGPGTRKEAIDAFLAKRPDIVQFIRDNTGISDPQKILEKWVYDVMQSEDSDWAEAKEILEKDW